MKIIIIGTSGQAGDIADIAIDNGYDNIIFLGEKDMSEGFCGFPVLVDTSETIEKFYNENAHFVIGIGDPKIRENIATKYPNLIYPTLIHSAATIGNFTSVDVGGCKGTMISAGCRITNNVRIGDHCFMGVNSVLGHDCIAEEYVSIMPGSVISGNVYLRKGAYIGTNAAVRQGNNSVKLSIGKYATIGMGAMVIKDVPDNCIALGVPATNAQK